MPNDLNFSRLCSLIDDSIHPYIKEEVISLTKDKEKDLLISLSQVFREIQVIKQKSKYDSDEESASDQKSWGGSEQHHEDHNCLLKILADLMVILTVESQFVHHLEGNILGVLSEFVMGSGSDWDFFIHSVFNCLELAISNVLSHSLPASNDGAGYSSSDPSGFVVLKSRLKNANWSTAATIIRVLRNTSKYLKQEGDDQLCKAFFGSVRSFLLNVPWDFMDKIQVGPSGGTRVGDSQNSVVSTFRYDDEKESKVVFLGNLIQLLCSLVEQSSTVENEIGSQDSQPILSIIVSSVPTLFHLCLGIQRNHVEMPISQYFKHKLLMLTLRLSYQISLSSSTLISWLQLLHDYFDELLRKPIIELEIGQGESLEGSPFLLNLSGADVQEVNSDHLQRWTILIFLRCCFDLISMTGETKKQCACDTPNSCLTFELISDADLNCCGRKKGHLELYKWLQGQLSTDMFGNHETNLEKCICFALSFLRLYIHEDDALFKVLLQLLSIHSCLDQWSKDGRWTSGNAEEIVSGVFNPVCMFHLFLAELHYDHQVLLDYLISKDTGISCAEYLLRCLRIVCNSWQLFITFSMHEKVVNRSSYKKRKTFLDGSHLQVEASSMSAKYIPLSLEEKSKKDFKNCCKHSKNTSPLFKNAENCLLSLKGTVENLHRKNLFPYNPEVLLKRLTKFQELCFD